MELESLLVIKMKTRLLIIIVLTLAPLSISNVSAICAAEALQWWEPCNDTGEFSDGIYVRYVILIPILTLASLSGIVLVFYRRKRK